MLKILSEKVDSYTNNGFTETVEFKILHQANVMSNHNKFWAAEIQKHPDGRYRIFTHYGRLGISNVYEVRQTADGKPITDYNSIKLLFDSLINKKLKGKTVDDPDNPGQKMREAYVDVDTVAPTVGSENIRGKSGKVQTVTIKKATIDTSSYDSTIAKLVDQLIEENVHNITTSTSIQYTANGFATAIGPVTPEHVAKARAVLDELNKLVDKNGSLDDTSRAVKDLNSRFFSLIPKPFGRKISTSDMILGAQQLEDEFELLDQLATGVQMGAALAGNTNQRVNALGTDIEILKNREDYKHIEDYIERSKATNHRGSDVWHYKVRRIFKIRIPHERQRYDNLGKKKGNFKEVFHGSSNSNILSILKSGLVVPPVNAPHVCGRMFGNGAYFANNSTKSLNYSIGFWGGRNSKYPNRFLLVADLALGKHYDTHDSLPSGTPKGYDSIWAHAGRSLYNDELITPNLEQQTLKYLVEMTR